MAPGRDQAALPRTPLRAVPDTIPSPGTPFEPARGPLRLTVLDDDASFVRVIGNRAEALGWEQRVFSAAPAVSEVAALRPSTVLLDPAACPGDPYEYLAALAAALPECGIVCASASSSVTDRVRGLRVGADDWIQKPAHPEEVIARLQAVARRRQALARTNRADPVTAGELQIRPDRFQAYVGGESVNLTRREYELLELLAGAEGRVLEREEIYSRVWGYTMPRGDRSVDVFVRKVRTKLRTASPGWQYVHTHFGVGYRFDPEPVDADDLNS